MSLLRKTFGIGMLWLPVMVIAACGGGSSSVPPPLPPPSGTPLPPATSTLNVDIADSEKTVLSGATFFSRVSGIADGVATSAISISCTNGVEPVIDGTLVEFTVPEVLSVLTLSVCTATVTERSGRSASDTLTITILPKTNVGQMVGVFDPSLKLALPNDNLPGAIVSYGSHIISIVESSDLNGLYQIKAIEGTAFVPRQYHRDDIVLVEGDYISIDFVQSPSLEAHGLPTASLSVASDLENRIYWHVQDLQSGVFTVREVIDVNRPCFIAPTNTLWANAMIVGQVNSGLTVFDIETGSNVTNTKNFVATLIQNIGAGRSLCHMLRGIIPNSIVEQYPDFVSSSPFAPAYATPLTAIDYNTLELVYYGDVNADNTLNEMGAVPIETNSTGQLKIVQVISHGGPSQVPRYLIVLLSDENHTGEHRVVQINFDEETHEFTQEVLHAWSEGVPVSMLQGPVGGSLEGGIFRADLVVVLGTTSKSLFFDNLLPLEEGFSKPPVYGQPVLFDVGLGAGSAVLARSPYGPPLNDPNHGVLVSYPESGNVFYISP